MSHDLVRSKDELSPGFGNQEVGREVEYGELARHFGCGRTTSICKISYLKKIQISSKMAEPGPILRAGNIGLWEDRQT